MSEKKVVETTGFGADAGFVEVVVTPEPAPEPSKEKKKGGDD